MNVWTRSSEDRAVLENVGRQFKYACIGAWHLARIALMSAGVPEGKKIGNDANRGMSSDVEFTSHNATQSRGSKSKGWTI